MNQWVIFHKHLDQQVWGPFQKLYVQLQAGLPPSLLPRVALMSQLSARPEKALPGKIRQRFPVLLVQS